ncbi:hypothetical protein CC78DRAFT_462885 [Lojkania enalia]|uniref:Uncharacterized protein n=1 Tax=Lojkania enalia TaxID=147567 RepID=A0A9P4N6K7_9PLEO|nr:hypothetical protein CC78DRAFT_462885 [Didymosphaeria enalia]
MQSRTRSFHTAKVIQNHPQLVVCDDSITLVSESLYLAYIRLRLQDRNKILWADALFISQQD